MSHRPQRPSLTALLAVCARVREQISPITFRPGVHSATHLQAAGFRYIHEGDAARCDECGLEVSGWTVDMDPFTIHKKQKPACPFVLFLRSPIPLHPAIFRDVPESQAVESTDPQSLSDKLIESQLLRDIRRRTFSHWPHRDKLSSENMAAAGFFSSTVDDRVACIYCNLFCHKWTPNVDDPYEVHKTLAPQCTYVRNCLTRHGRIQTINANGNSIRMIPNSLSLTQKDTHSTNAKDLSPRIQQNNASGPTGTHLSVTPFDDMIQAGYLDTNTENNGKCPVCGGLINFLVSREHPMIAHARQHPRCAYARQFLSIGPFGQIAGVYQSILLLSHSNTLGSNLAKRIAAGLDLAMSKHVLEAGIPADVLRECWERQLKVNDEDFESEGALYIACLVVQKERRHIRGDPERIIVPCTRMWELRQNAKNDHHTRLSAAGRSNDQPPLDSCEICATEEKRLACVPCGHLATCVPCGHSLRSCPICRQAIEAFVRIYV